MLDPALRGRIAFFSPLPPARSGIADYSEAVLEHLRGLAEVEVFTDTPPVFDAAKFDACIYQLGNNPFHTFVYEMALQHPGIVVMHEANLHHLVADFTIRRGNWDEYLREVELDGGREALDYAKRYVQPLRRGPDYELPMLASVLKHSKAAIVHSDFVGDVVRSRGFQGPIAKIPHGAWIYDEAAVARDGAAYRTNLGVAKGAPLFGVFGFLKPYKRIAETLRAFKSFIEVRPDARLILVGEAHPELVLERLLAGLGLSGHVRHIDYAPIEDFNGYMAACDAVINLRYPTVGETSGTLLRSLGLGKPVLVSEIGSFREYPDEVCLKVPVDASEEQHIFGYMELLMDRPEIAQELGSRARAWVAKECSWELVAKKYAEFASASAKARADSANAPAAKVIAAVANASPVAPDYILGWTSEEDGSRNYAKIHETRLVKTLEVTPRGGAEDRVLEMGAYLQITPALKTKLGYGEVRGCYFGELGRSDKKIVKSETGEVFECMVDHFDAERDRFPYEDSSFSTVLCCELVEHLPTDPMHMMGEINRILKQGGHLVMTTPNVVSLRALAGILQGFHPMLFPSYIKPNPGGEPDPRHAREYTPNELKRLLEDSGFEVTLLTTGPFLQEPSPQFAWVEHLLHQYILTEEHRGDGIYIVGRKTGPVRSRYPGWLYA